MINLTNKTIQESISLANDYETIKIPVRGPVSKVIYFIAEKVNYNILYGTQRLAKICKKYSSKIDDIIEEKIGEEANIPDFFNPYPQEQILVLAIAYPFGKKTTIMEIADHYKISKRQAIRVKTEIENCFPSLPAGKKVWEIMNDENNNE